MLDLSKYSCDKCKRNGSWHCKRCWHTVNNKPTHFKPKKKTGVQTPELRKPTPPPPPPTRGSNAVKPNPNYIPPASVKENCAYSTPCGYCTKWDKKCDKKIGCDDCTNHFQYPPADVFQELRKIAEHAQAEMLKEIERRGKL